MRLGIIVAGICVGLIPAIAAAQQGNQMQSVIDQKTADVTSTIGLFRNQIMADQTQIETLTAQNEALKKQVAAKKPEPPAGQPQLGTGK